MRIRLVTCVVLLALGGAVAMWRSQASTPGATAASGGSSALDETRRCLEGTPGYQVRENPKAEGARQLLVTSPVGVTTRDGNVTMTHDSSATVIFFKSHEDAAGWADALQDISSSQVGGAAPNQTIGNVIIGWSVPAPAAEIKTVHDCVAG